MTPQRFKMLRVSWYSSAGSVVVVVDRGDDDGAVDEEGAVAGGIVIALGSECDPSWFRSNVLLMPSVTQRACSAVAPACTSWDWSRVGLYPGVAHAAKRSAAAAHPIPVEVRGHRTPGERRWHTSTTPARGVTSVVAPASSRRFVRRIAARAYT